MIRTAYIMDSFVCPDEHFSTFSLKLTRLLRISESTDKDPVSVTRVTCCHIYGQPCFTDTGYLRTVYFHLPIFVPVADIQCTLYKEEMSDFYWLIRFMACGVGSLKVVYSFLIVRFV